MWLVCVALKEQRCLFEVVSLDSGLFSLSAQHRLPWRNPHTMGMVIWVLMPDFGRRNKAVAYILGCSHSYKWPVDLFLNLWSSRAL